VQLRVFALLRPRVMCGRAAGSSQKTPSFAVPSRQLDRCFIGFRRDGGMGLFLILYWCSIVAGDVSPINSRFGVFIPRLGRSNSPLNLPRELAGKGLIRLADFAAKTAVFVKNRENSRFDGEKPGICPFGRTGGGACRQRGVSGGHPKRFERGKPFGTRRPAAPRAPSHGARLISVRVRFSPCRHDKPSARRNTLQSARPPDL
jgi:hypothetical protein